MIELEPCAHLTPVGHMTTKQHEFEFCLDPAFRSGPGILDVRTVDISWENQGLDSHYPGAVSACFPKSPAGGYRCIRKKLSFTRP